MDGFNEGISIGSTDGEEDGDVGSTDAEEDGKIVGVIDGCDSDGCEVGCSDG